MNNEIQIAHFTKEDWSMISTIYQEGIDTGIATFETEVPSWKQWDNSHIKSCRIKAIVKEKILGWAALSPISKRKVYKGVGEVSIYVSKKYRGRGVGKLLLSQLIKESEQTGIWTLQASVFSNNNTSIILHKSLGFREIGYREKVAKLHNKWYDNTILERRSKKII
ncbi:GNAT family N-acetyltransferase [Aquimarina longa]|uniref:GNAT family N-acetyltransferase n=1 Tax=Aquimarina longa TaxID=1080221 RepID=UPI0007828C69|nr:GNAT family N-acetyltransferase [Aquimarina longa]